MHGFERAKGLVNEILAVIVRKILSPNNSMHVRLHQFLTINALATAKVGIEEEAYLDEIDFSETFVVPGLLNVKNGNNILVIEVSEQLHLS
jgi:hypothetical protein